MWPCVFTIACPLTSRKIPATSIVHDDESSGGQFQNRIAEYPLHPLFGRHEARGARRVQNVLVRPAHPLLVVGLQQRGAGLANPVLSILEDASTLMLFALAVLVPLVVIAMLGIMTYLVVRRFARSRSTVAAA